MSVIIRLQNLPWSANALDIRQYFRGLSIPEGGVHIVGGEQGDAFIAFSTDEDARQAFNLNNGKIKEIQIKLMLSSRTEMQKVIEAARTQSLAAFMQSAPVQLPSAVPPILPTVIPSAIPEIKRNDKDNNLNNKRDKRRSRSRSRERKDRSRERDRRDRRRRDRSRTRSRERRERRRRERSRSRDRTRSKERDLRSKDRRSIESTNNSNIPTNLVKDTKIGVWESPLQNENVQLQQPSLLGQYPAVAAIAAAVAGNNSSLLEDRIGFQNQRETFGSRWNPTQNAGEGLNNLQNRRYQNQNDDRFEPSQGRSRPGVDQFKNNYDGNRPGFNRSVKPDSRFNDRQEKHQGDNFNCCVQLRPYYGAFGEVRRFFQGIFIHNTGIKFVNDDYGKRTGLVYIKFAYADGKEEALARNGSMLRNQIVEITHVDDEVFENTVDRYQPEHGSNSYTEDEESESRFRGKNITKYFNKNNSQSQSSPPPKVFSCLIVEDLPTYAKEQDILKMFSEYPLMSIIMVNKPRKVHVAYVQFSNPEDAKTAQQETNKHVVDGKPVTVGPCRDDVFDTVQREQSEIPEEPEKPTKFITSDCVLLTRLPLKTNDRDISDFFSDIGIIPTKIHLMSNSMGFVGEAYCEFNTSEEARAAIEKDSQPLGSSIVSVKSVERSDMENMLGIHVIPDSPPPSLDTLPRSTGMPQNIRPPPMSQPLGQQSRQFFPRTNYGPGPRGPSFLGPRLRRFPAQHIQNGSDDSFGPPGCTVLMENVPYKATVEEILQFFNGYEIPADNILRRYNPNGKPSGESKVIFKNPEDAYQAVHEKQRQTIRDRTVYLTLC